MIIIAQNDIDAVSWGSEDANWPAANCLDDHIRHVTRSALQQDTLTISVSRQGNSLYLGGVSADSAVITVRDGSGAEVETHELDFIAYDDIEAFLFDEARVHTSAWLTYTYQEEAHTLEIAFTAATGETPEVGIARAGFGTGFPNGVYGLQTGTMDLSIVESLASGGIYRRDRDVVRTWSGTINGNPEAYDGWRFLEFKRQIKKRPFACLVLDGLDDRANAVYVHFHEDPATTRAGHGVDELNFTLIEEV